MTNVDNSAYAQEDLNDPAPPAAPNPAPAPAPTTALAPAPPDAPGPPPPAPAPPTAPTEEEFAPGVWLPELSQADYLENLLSFCPW